MRQVNSTYVVAVFDSHDLILHKSWTCFELIEDNLSLSHLVIKGVFFSKVNINLVRHVDLGLHHTSTAFKLIILHHQLIYSWKRISCDETWDCVMNGPFDAHDPCDVRMLVITSL